MTAFYFVLIMLFYIEPDMQSPNMTCPSSFNVQTDDTQSTTTVILPYPSDVIDNSGEDVTVTTSPANNTVHAIGSIDFVYTAMDQYGNSYMCNVTVTVEGQSYLCRIRHFS